MNTIIEKIEQEKNEQEIIKRIERAITYLYGLIGNFDYTINIEKNPLMKIKIFIYTNIRKLTITEIKNIPVILEYYNFNLDSISSRNKKFKGCLTFEISIN